MGNSKQLVLAVFWDYINIKLDTQQLQKPLKKFIVALREDGTVITQRVYFRTGVSDDVINEFYINGFSSTLIPKSVEPEDQMLVDCMSTYFEHPEINSYLLVTDESKVMPLIHFLRSRGKEVKTFVPDVSEFKRKEPHPSSIPHKNMSAEINKEKKKEHVESYISLGKAESIFKEVIERDYTGEGIALARLDQEMRKLNSDYTGYRCIKDKHGGKFSSFSQFVEEVCDRLNYEIRMEGGAKRVFRRTKTPDLHQNRISTTQSLRIPGPQKINYNDWVLIFEAIEKALAETSPLTEHGLFMKVRLLKRGSHFSQMLTNREIKECVHKIIEDNVLASDLSHELPKYYIDSNYPIRKSLFLGEPSAIDDFGSHSEEMSEDYSIEEEAGQYDELDDELLAYEGDDQEFDEFGEDISDSLTDVEVFDGESDDFEVILDESVDTFMEDDKLEHGVEIGNALDDVLVDADSSLIELDEKLVETDEGLIEVNEALEETDGGLIEVNEALEDLNASLNDEDLGDEPSNSSRLFSEEETSLDLSEESPSEEQAGIVPLSEDPTPEVDTQLDDSVAGDMDSSPIDENIPDYSFSLDTPVSEEGTKKNNLGLDIEVNVEEDSEEIDSTSTAPTSSSIEDLGLDIEVNVEEDSEEIDSTSTAPTSSSIEDLGLDIEVSVEEVDEDELRWDTEEDATRSMDRLLQEILESKEEAESIHNLVKEALRSTPPSGLESDEKDEPVDLGDKVLKGHLFEKNKRFRPY